MKITDNFFIAVGVLLGVFFVVLLIFVSLLGENNKIDSVVDTFFENIKDQRYFSVEDNQGIVENLNVFDIDGDYSENCLFLKLALLEKYNISDTSDYKIDIEKSHFWVPFTGNSNIQIHLNLEKHEGIDVFSFFKRSKKKEFVNNLFTVERKDGGWQITAINVQDSSLFNSFNRIKTDLNFDSYVSFSGTNLVVQPIIIDTKNITNFERHKLNYIFQKLSQLIETKEHSIEKP